MNKKDLYWIKLMNFFSKHWNCHRMPERSFFFKGYQFPICARCTGILIGCILGPIIYYIKSDINFIICILLILPMIFDGFIQLYTNYKSNNIKRFITGIFFSSFSIYIIIVIFLYFKRLFF
jgi:uncharacterized membrane protein